MDSANPEMADRPWGATRLGPYPTTVQMPFTAVGIDPATQLGVFRDASGQIVKMDTERTQQFTSNPTSTYTSTHNSTSTNMVNSSDTDHHNDSDSNSDFNSDYYPG